MSLSLGISIGCDDVTLRILDKYEMDCMDPLGTSLPLGEITTERIYGNRNLNDLPAEIIGESTKEWIEKVLLSSGLKNRQIIATLALPSLIKEDCRQNLIKTLGTIDNLSIGSR